MKLAAMLRLMVIELVRRPLVLDLRNAQRATSSADATTRNLLGVKWVVHGSRDGRLAKNDALRPGFRTGYGPGADVSPEIAHRKIGKPGHCAFWRVSCFALRVDAGGFPPARIDAENEAQFRTCGTLVVNSGPEMSSREPCI